jgi:hypothetical protein
MVTQLNANHPPSLSKQFFKGVLRLVALFTVVLSVLHKDYVLLTLHHEPEQKIFDFFNKVQNYS